MTLTSAQSRAIKAKGRNAEQAVVDLARVSGWPHAERRRLTGTSDRGDIAGMPAIVTEVKAGARDDLGTWMRETETERVNDGADYGITVVKMRGRPVDQWPAVLPLAAMLRLLNAAGYGGTTDLPPAGVTRYPPAGAATDIPARPHLRYDDHGVKVDCYCEPSTVEDQT